MSAVPRPARSAALAEVLRRCESAGTGLRVESPGAPRIALAWLEEAANVGGGLVRQGGSALWLLGGAAGPCLRARDLIQGMGWSASLLEFPRDLPAMEAAWAAEVEAPPLVPPSPAGLEDRAARLPPEAGHALAALWRMEAAGPQLLAQRWMADPGALPAPPGSDWHGHATTLLAHRLLARAGRGEWPAGHKAHLPLLLDLPWMPPPASLPPPPPGAGHAVILPLASLAELAGWQAAAAGWELAWAGLTPGMAHLLGSLPGHYVFAAPGLDEGFPASPRLVLTGLTERRALARAVAAGFAVSSPLE